MILRNILGLVLPLGFLRLHFGGSSSSNSKNEQIYNDNRTVTSNDSHDTSLTSNWSSVDSSVKNYTSSDSTSYSSSYSSSAADSHDVSNSGNTSSSTQIYWTGTDQGAQHLADLAANLADQVSARSLDGQALMAGLAGNIGDRSAHLAEVSAANSMALSTHMLDLTGELIDRVATGTQSLVASQSAAGQAAASVIAAANKNAASTSDSLKTQVLAGLAVIALVAFLKKA